MDQQSLQTIKDFSVTLYTRSKSRRHDIGHIERIWRNARAIAKAIRPDLSFDTKLLEAACYLHDAVLSTHAKGTFASNLYSHVFEKKLIKKYLPSVLLKFRLAPKDREILMTAIINHPYSLPYRRLNRNSDVYSKILQDADSLDYVSSERQKQFKAAHPTLSLFVTIYLSFLRKNIRNFLNFPEVGSLYSSPLPLDEKI